MTLGPFILIALNLLIERLAEYGKTNDWDVTQGENASKLGRMISEEMLLHMWNKVTETKNMKTIQNFHKFIGNYLVEVVNNSKNLS